jgi:hypothetical protein
VDTWSKLMGLFDAFSGKGARDAAAAKAAGFNTGRANAFSLVDASSDELRRSFDQARQPWDPLYRKSMTGFDAYDDAAGLGGAQGYDRAMAAFRASPGYQFSLNSGLDALDRRAASRGMLASGNTNLDTLNYAKGLADQEWGNYVSRLAPYLTQAQAAAGAQSQLAADLGKTLNANSLYKAGVGFQADTGIGSANAEAAMADTNASMNAWKALLDAGGVAAKLWGKANK